MKDKWKFWMKNSGFGGSAPWITLEIHRVNSLRYAEYESMFGTNIGAFHLWQEGVSTKYFNKNDLDIFNAGFLSQVHENQEILQQWWNAAKKRGEKLVGLADKINPGYLKSAENRELKNLVQGVADSFWELGVYSSIPLFGGWALQEILEPKLADAISSVGEDFDSFGQYYTSLTSGRYIPWQKIEEKALRSIAEEIKSKGLDAENLPQEFEMRLQEHARQFEWVPYKWIGPVWSLDDFRERLSKMAEGEKKKAKKMAARDQIISRLKLDAITVREFDALAFLGDLKEMKGNYMSRAAYQLGKFRLEMQRRFNLTERQTALMLSDDYLRMLVEGDIDRDKISRRQKGFLWHAENGVESFYSGQEALDRFNKEFEWQSEIKNRQFYEGTPVFPGKFAGLAKKILRYEKDKGKFKEGDILVAYRTTPHYTPLIDIASAIITSEGGLTQHAAQVAREYEIPCVVGASNIIEGVEDEQPLLVDANTGRIEKITKEECAKIRKHGHKKKKIQIMKKPLVHYAGPGIIWMEEASHKHPERELIGNKAANQAISSRMFNVPNGFMVTTSAYYQFMEESGMIGKLGNIASRIERAGMNPEEIEKISKEYMRTVMHSDVNGFFDNIRHAYKILGSQSTVTRSSGIYEDGKSTGSFQGSSFAGIFETFLNHRDEDDVVNGIKKCWASLFSPRSLFYAVKSGVDPSSNQMCVLVQEMKNGSVSGVLYTGIDGYTMVEACEGLCDPLVAGRITPALYIMDGDMNIALAKQSSQKKAEYIDQKGGYSTRLAASQNPLGKKELFELGMIGRKMQEYFGAPQDVEWTITDRIYITQNRDLTSKPMLPEELSK